MRKIIKNSIYFCFIMVCIFYLCLLFSIDNPIIERVVVNDTSFYRFNFNEYLVNLNGVYNKFNLSFTNIGNYVINFDNFVNGLKSILNIVIFIGNLLILPLCFAGAFTNFIFALLCVPMNSTNFLYVFLNNLSGLQIPYIAI